MAWYKILPQEKWKIDFVSIKFCGIALNSLPIFHVFKVSFKTMASLW